MKPITLEKTAEIIGGQYRGDPERRGDVVTGAVIDSRAAGPGSLFACIKGDRTDGHGYIAAAAANGAVCCLCEREVDSPVPYTLVGSTRQALHDLAAWYRSTLDIPVVGVTGSVGKTTAKEMTAAVLSRRYSVLKTEANLNNELGVPLTLLSIDEGHQAAVVEMGISDFGEMSRLAAMVRPDVLIFTCVGYCHLENLGDLNGVLRAKGEVFAYMKKDGLAVLFSDDEPLRSFDPGIRKISYGFGPDNDFRAENVVSRGLEGIGCDIVTPAGRFAVTIPAFGTHIAAAALAAAAVGRELGLTDGEIAAGLTDYRPVGSRANVVKSGDITIIDDCYNANPNSVSASLRSVAALEGRRVAVLGDMLELGENETALHRAVGALAAELDIDMLLCCGELSRSTAEGYRSAGGRDGRWYGSKDELIASLGDTVRDGDTVLVKASHSMGFDAVVSALRKS